MTSYNIITSPHSGIANNVRLSIFRLVILTFLVTLLTSVSWADKHATKTLLIVGDSISAGFGMSLEKSWPTLLEKHLEAEQQSFAVVNASISGETSAGGLARLPALLKKHQPDIVIIELGGNDGLRGFPIPTIRNNLTQLVTRSQQAGAEVLLLGMRIPPNYGPAYTDMFFASYAKVAEETHCALLPFFLEGVATNPQLMQADGIHPAAAAQQTLLENVLPLLQPLIKNTLSEISYE